MNVESLRERYEAVKNSDDYDTQMDFIELLLSSKQRDVIAYHYDLLRHRQNEEFYFELRAAFGERGDAGAKFLVEKSKDEKDAKMRADILHLLGTMNNTAALPLARQALQSSDPKLRDRGCYVLGWMGEAEDIDLLRDRLLNDPSPEVRADAATAHDQMKDHLPKSKNSLLRNLKEALEKENDKEVAGWIVVTVQYILKKQFGMKEDIEEAELKGDVAAAKRKCLQALEKFKL